MTEPFPTKPSIRSADRPTGLRRLLRALGHSARGLRACWREEAAFRQECVLAVGVIPAGAYVGATGVERALLVSPMLLILIVELLNSGIEAAIDRIGPESHALSGLAKDVGSAAVLMSFAVLVLDWTFVLLGH